MPPKQRKSANDSISCPCLVCSGNVSDNDKTAILCELCDGWVHSKCVHLPSAVLAYFKSPDYTKSDYAFPFYCSNCNPIRVQMKDLPAKAVITDQRLLALEDKIANLVETAKKPAFPFPPPNFAVPTPGPDLQLFVKDALEVESKKPNAVLFGLGDTDDDLDAVRRLVSENENIFIYSTRRYQRRNGRLRDMSMKKDVKNDLIIRFADRIENFFKDSWFQYALNYSGLGFTLFTIASVFVVNGYVTCPSLYSADECTGPLTFGYFVILEIFSNFFLFHYCKRFNRVDSLLPDCRRSNSAVNKNRSILPTTINSTLNNDLRHSGSKQGTDFTLANCQIDTSARDATSKYCATCDMLVPWRSHHCPICDYCILKKDHHCYFMGGCVGFGNQRYFIVFLFWAFVGAAYGSSLSLRYLNAFYEPFLPFGWIDYIFPLALKKWVLFRHCSVQQLVMVFLCSAGLASAGVCFVFSILQWLLIYRGKTFMEQQSRKASANHYPNTTFCQNVRMVFGPYCILNYLVPLPFKNKYDESFKKWLYDAYVKEL